jgi:adenylylsulfate kinase-like enzyme
MGFLRSHRKQSECPFVFYKKARSGQLPNMTGINSPYEAPINPELIVDTAQRGVEAALEEINQLLLRL